MPNSTAKFYYRSYIDQDLDGYTLSGGIIPTANVNDRRKATYAITTGLGTDGNNAEIEADLHTDRAIDTIFLKSNFKTFTVYCWDENETGTGGAGYVELTSYASNTSGFLVISFSEISTSKIKIACTHTIAADEEKTLYTLEITQALGELNIESIDQAQAHERENYKNIYGGSVQVVKYPNRGKTNINLSWENMTTTDYAVYAMLKTQSLIDAYLIYFYFSDDYDLLDDEALFLMNDIAEKEATPSNEALTAGVNGKMELREC